MIKIKNIKLKDFGRHTNLDQSCDGFVIGLTGPNGRGKSTVLQAIQLGLTGTIDHPDPLHAFIRRCQGDKSPKSASVEVAFEADGKQGTITRKITRTTNSRELVWEGLDAPVTSEKRVTEVLFEILGVDKKAVNSTVFIRQGEMTNMFGRDTDRRDFYMRLLMLGHMEKIADVVDNYRKQISDTVQDLSAVKDEAEAAYNEASEQFTALDNELRGMYDPGNDLVMLRRLVRAYDELTAADQALQDSQAALVAVLAGRSERSLSDAVTANEAAVAALAALQAAHGAAVLKLLNAERALQAARNANAVFVELDQRALALQNNPPVTTENPSGYLLELRQLAEKLQRRVELESQLPAAENAAALAVARWQKATADYTTVTQAGDALSQRIRPLKADVALRKNLLKELAGCQTANCPVCGSAATSTDYLSQAISAIEAELQPLEQELAANTSAAAAASVEMAAATTAEREASGKVELMRAELGRLRGALLLVQSEAELQAAIAAQTELVVQWQAATQSHAAAQQAYDAALAATAGLQRITDQAMLGLEADVEAAKVFEPLPTDFAAQQAAAAEALQTSRQEMQRVRDRNAQSLAHRARQQLAASALQQISEELTRDFPMLLQALLTHGTLTLVSAMTELEALTRQQQEYNVVAGKCQAAKEALRRADARVNEIELKMAEQAHRRKLVDDLSSVRDAFKPGGAPIEYLDYKFGQIARMAADYLAESQADFMVTASPDAPLAFDFVRLDRPDEVWMPQNRLSGGQKVRLAVATLRAIHALVMPNVGLLVLDEPTTHLDDEARRSMAEMLKRIGDEGTLQMIVCDHSPELVDAFSDTIELDE